MKRNLFCHYIILAAIIILSQEIKANDQLKQQEISTCEKELAPPSLWSKLSSLFRSQIIPSQNSSHEHFLTLFGEIRSLASLIKTSSKTMTLKDPSLFSENYYLSQLKALITNYALSPYIGQGDLEKILHYLNQEKILLILDPSIFYIIFQKNNFSFASTPQITLEIKGDQKKIKQEIKILLQILKHPHKSTYITGLHLVGLKLDHHFAKAIALSPHLQKLEVLNLHDNDIQDTGVEYLSRSPNLAHVKILTLSRNDFSLAGALSIANSSIFTNVTDLDLSYNRFEDEGAIALAHSSYLHQLSRLTLSFNGIRYRGAHALTTSPLVKKLTSLNLAFNPLEARGINSLITSSNLDELKDLDLSTTSMGNEGALLIARSPLFSHLENLSLSGNMIQAEGAQALTDSPYLSHVMILRLDNNLIQDEGALTIANSAYLKRLIILGLKNNRIGPLGLRALLSSLNFQELRSLDLSLNPLEEALKASSGEPLLHSPHLQIIY
jgi:hypothetical protein